MTISPALTVAAVQPFHTPAPQPHALREQPQPGPAKVASRPVATEILPTQPVAMPPVVTALTADFEAGRAAAEAARTAYLAERRQSQS
jgi:hypothetical protein